MAKIERTDGRFRKNGEGKTSQKKRKKRGRRTRRRGGRSRTRRNAQKKNAEKRLLFDVINGSKKRRKRTAVIRKDALKIKERKENEKRTVVCNIMKTKRLRFSRIGGKRREKRNLKKFGKSRLTVAKSEVYLCVLRANETTKR